MNDNGNTELTDREVDAVTAAVVEASRTALDWFRPSVNGGSGDRHSGSGGSRPLLIENKRADGHWFDPVTEADRSVEALVRAELRSMFPEDAIVGEEFGAEGSGSRCWYVDPIDGTQAFVTGQPMWGTLLGLTVGGRPVAGWMYLPVLDEVYVGTGGSAWWSRVDPAIGVDGPPDRGVPLRSADTSSLADAVVLCTHPSMFAPGPSTEQFDALAERVKMVRYGGDCMNYGLLASGDADLVVENQLAPYDIIPLIPVVTGAGGVVTDLTGAPPVNGGWAVAAATPDLHRAALDVLAGSATGTTST